MAERRPRRAKKDYGYRQFFFLQRVCIEKLDAIAVQLRDVVSRLQELSNLRELSGQTVLSRPFCGSDDTAQLVALVRTKPPPAF